MVVLALALALPSLAFGEPVNPDASSIVIGVGPMIPPLLEQDGHGELNGFVVDFLKKAARRANLVVRFELIPDEAALKALDPAQTPLICWLQNEWPREGYVPFTNGFLSLHTAVFRRRGESGTGTISASELGEIIAVNKSEGHRDLVDEGARKIFTTDTIDEAVRLLASGKHNTLFANEMATLDAIRRLKLDTVVEVPSPEMHMHQRYRLQRAADRADLEAALEPVLYNMRHDGGYDASFAEWFGPLETSDEVPWDVFWLSVGAVAFGGAVLGLVLYASRRRIAGMAQGLGQDLRESETRMEAIMSASPTGIFRLDLEGRVTFGNEEAARITGLGRGPIGLANWLNAIHPDDRAVVSAAWRRVRTENIHDHREYRFVHPSGEIVWVLDRGQPELDEQGRIIGFIGTLTDITQIKRAEQTLRTYSQVFLNMTEGVNTVDADRNILYANEAFEKMFGYEPGELIGKNVSLLSPVSVEEYETRRSEIRQQLQERGFWSGEMRNKRKDGSVFWTAARISRVEGAGPTYAVCVQEDITERKRAEDALRASEEKFRRVAESALVGVSILDGTRFSYANQAMIEQTGYTIEELGSRNRAEMLRILCDEGEPERVMPLLAQLDATDGPQFVDLGEVRARHKSGTIRWLWMTVAQLYPGRPFPRLLVSVDTTERHRAEEAMRTSEEKFRRVAESALVGIAITDHGKFTFSNEAMIELSGYRPEDLNSMDRLAVARLLLGDEVQEEAIAALLKLDDSGQSAEPVVIEEARIRHKNGGTRWARVTVSRLYPEEPFPRLFIAVDITARKLAEESLRAHSQVLMGMAEGVVFTDDDGVVLDTNPAFEAMFGYARGELKGQHITVLSDYSEQELAALSEQMDADINARGMWSGVVRDRRKDGSIIWTQLRLTRTVVNGKPAYVGVQADITESLRAERALRESEEKFRAVAESAMIGLVIADHANITYVNDALIEMTGYRLEDFAGLDRQARLATLFEGEDLQRVARVAAQAANTDASNAPLAASQFPEMRLRRKDGSYRWVSVLVNPLYDDRVFPVLIAMVDNTERRHAEEALRTSEYMLRHTQRIARVGGWQIDLATNQVTLSDETRRIYEVPDDFVPTAPAIFSFYPTETQDRIRAAGDRVRATREPQIIESRMVTHSGTPKWLRLSIEPIVRDDAVVCLTGAVQDISDLKRVEDSLREREAHLRAIVESEPECVKLVDASGIVLDMNPAGLAAVEADSVDQVRGENAVNLIAPEFKDVFLRSMSEVFAGRASKVEFEIIGRKGTRRWLEQSAVPLWDTEQPGKVRAMLAVARDITERRRMEEALRRSEELFRAISEQMPDSLLLLDLDDQKVPGRIRYANAAAARMHQMTMDELIGMPISSLDAPGTAKQAPERMDQLRRGETIYFEGEHIRKDGSVFPVDVVARKIPALGNNVVLAIDRDITERRNAEEERRRIEARMQQAQRLESLGVLTGGIAHDFNNLLAGILGHADLARADAPAEGPLRESIDQIEVAARRASDLVEQMLAYAGRGNFVVRRVRLGNVVRELAKLLEVTLSKGAQLVFEIDDSAPPIAADGSQIQQVVMNLITNASDALGDRPGTITLRSGVIDYTEEALIAYAPHQPPKPGRFVYLEVADTGCGMDPATLDRIFDPFFSTKFTGRGLGLAATLGIIRRHEGGLRVTSVVGRGTTFRVILPALNDDVPTGDSPAPAMPRPLGRPATLLVVDDEPRVRDFLARALERFGHRVLVAPDGREALALFEQQGDGIDGVLLDITMPGMGGGEVLHKLHARRPSLPVMLMSGFTEAETRQTLEHNGYAAFLQKPFSLDTLRAAVDALFAVK